MLENEFKLLVGSLLLKITIFFLGINVPPG